VEIDYDSMDEETAAAVRAAIQQKEQELDNFRSAAERKNLIFADEELKTKYPRAVNALRTKLIAEPEVAVEQLGEWLDAKEKEYVAMNVADPFAVVAPTPAASEPAVPPNPAQGWGSAVASGPAPTVDIAEGLKGSLSSVRRLEASTITQLDALNASAEGRRSLRELTYELSDKRPIVAGMEV